LIVGHPAVERRPRYREAVYDYSAEVTAFVDGDTLHIQLDRGEDEYGNQTIRLFGINCPEHNAEGGPEATEFTRQWLFDNGWVTTHTDLWGSVYKKLHVRVVTIKDKKEKFGRYLGRILNAEGTACLNDDLLEAGHAVVYLP
jgi:endonuclease YncB( thermonuclease family)